MAEEEVVILEAEDDVAPLVDENEEESSAKPVEIPKDDDKNKKIIIIAGAVAAFVIVILIVVVIVVLKNKKPPQVENINPQEIVKKLTKKEDIGQFSKSKVEDMIRKANLLYAKGQKQEALKIYGEIATFNQAISSYNIGVAKMKEKNYKDAIKAFKKAILNAEQKTISSINAAVCALHLHNMKLFEYYIDLAYAYVPNEINSPLYSYEISLINYYRNFYYEALSSLKHPSSRFYKDEQKYLSSKILSYIDNNKEAIDMLMSINSDITNLPLGLLYARIGEYLLAKKHLVKALNTSKDKVKVKMALALVENKLGNLNSCAKLLGDARAIDEQKAKNLYPIEVILKKSLFDVNLAQKNFTKKLFFNEENTYALLFYFSPYKIFDSTQTVEYIRKGSINTYLDELTPALSYLSASSSISKVNSSIAKGIKKALANHIFQANMIFKSLLPSYPNHSILHYNLALTYAQIGDYALAYKHFSTSYHLDNTNYLAGVYAIFAGKLLKKDISKLSEDVKSSMQLDKHLKPVNLYSSLINLSENNQFSLSRWIENDKSIKPLNLAFDIIIAQKISNQEFYRKKTQELKAKLPKDLMSNILYFNMNNYQKKIKDYAKAFQIYFKDNRLNLSSFYYGAKIARIQYVKLLQISGLLYHQRDEIKKRLPLEREDAMSLTYTLAYLDIFTHNFEESYVMYNKLIDDYKRKDSKTIFQASVAAIGARHIENAIALLELSKLIDPTNMESRYALGLLYQEVRNFKGASIQYSKIGDSGFKSKFFSFKIDK
jgi:tetratricopeptide (TPR) repeat protein